jgi:hypothetical protein
MSDVDLLEREGEGPRPRRSRGRVIVLTLVPVVAFAILPPGSGETRANCRAS